MRKLSLKELNLKEGSILQREQIKNVVGGDGFDCGSVAYNCDARHPEVYRDFIHCMHWAGCA